MIDAQWSQVTGPIEEPIGLADLKQHLRITTAQDDAALVRYLRAAREAAEDHLNRGLLTQTWQLTLGEWCDVIWLPRAAPLQNAAVPATAPIVQYYDPAGTLQTLSASAYVVDTTSRPGRLLRATGHAWPALRSEPCAARIVITYVIGWTSAEAIPERIKEGIRLYAAWLDADRSGLEPLGVTARQRAEMCWDDRVMWIEANAWP